MWREFPGFHRGATGMKSELKEFQILAEKNSLESLRQAYREACRKFVRKVIHNEGMTVTKSKKSQASFQKYKDDLAEMAKRIRVLGHAIRLKGGKEPLL